MNDLSNSSAINVALPQVETLMEIGAQLFDPVRFRFIQSLTQRIDRHTGSSKKQIEQRALEAIEQYRLTFETKKSEALKLAKAISEKHPEQAEAVDDLLQQGNFKALERLQKKLARSAQFHSANRSQLTELIRQLASDDFIVESNQEPDLHRQLERQEAEARKSITTGLPTSTSGRVTSTLATGGELKSIRKFRESWNKVHTKQLVADLVTQGPKDAGPLNPERLAIRSLSAMQDISPEYLNRFVGYIETLLWLQQINDKNLSVKKKNKPSKSKK